MLLAAFLLVASGGAASLPSASASLVPSLATLAQGWTVLVPNSNGTVSLAYSPHLSTGEHVRAASLALATPAAASSSPSSVEIKDPVRGATLWDWPYSFGTSSLHPVGGGSLTANNGSAVGLISLPPSNITGGSALVQNVGGAMEPGYHIELSLGGIPLYERNGTPPFLPFSPLSWGIAPDGGNITRIASGEATSTTELVAFGDEKGGVTVLDVLPGSNASTLYSTAFSPRAPVAAVAVAQVFPSSLPSVLASAGFDLYILGPAPTGGWTNALFTTDRASNGTLPSATALGGGTVGSTPTVLVTTVGDDLEELTWSSTSGWNTPVRVLTFPSAMGTLADVQLNASTLRFAVGGPDGVGLYDQSSAAPELLSNLTLGSSVGADKVVLNSTGTGLLALGTDGSLYSASAPAWGVAKVGVPSGWSSLSLYSSSGAPDAAVLMAQNGSLWQLLQPFGPSPELRLVAQAPQVSSGATPITASIYGTDEADVLAADHDQLVGAEYTPSFSSASAPNWIAGIQSYVREATPTPDSVGNEIVQGSVALTVEGGACGVADASVTYNATVVQNVSSWVGSAYATLPSSGVLNLTTVLSAGSAGVLHAELRLMVEMPVTAPPVPLSTQIQDFFASSGLVLAGGVAAGGAACLVVGRIFYLRRPHTVSTSDRAGAQLGAAGEPGGTSR